MLLQQNGVIKIGVKIFLIQFNGPEIELFGFFLIGFCQKARAVDKGGNIVRRQLKRAEKKLPGLFFLTALQADFSEQKIDVGILRRKLQGFLSIIFRFLKIFPAAEDFGQVIKSQRFLRILTGKSF